MVLVNVNIVKKKKKLIDKRLHCFSKIFSFDKDDCSQYGYIFHPTIYSVQKLGETLNVDTDVFFIGTYTEEIYKKLIQLYKYIT